MAMDVDTRRAGLRRWAGLALAAGTWLVLYRFNQPFWDWLIYDVLGLSPQSAEGSALHFFGYDVAKIGLLLVGIIFAVTVLRSFMSIERTRALLGGRREGVGNVMAAGLGVITPFCSCSAVPAFIGFVAAGVPIGVTMSTTGTGAQMAIRAEVRHDFSLISGFLGIDPITLTGTAEMQVLTG